MADRVDCFVRSYRSFTAAARAELRRATRGVFAALLALQPDAPRLAGTVRSGATHEPLVGATVTLPELNRATVTDDRGRYLFRDVSAGPVEVAVRFLGYAPRALHAFVPRDGLVEVSVALAPLATSLPTVRVRHVPNAAVRGLGADSGARYPDRVATAAALAASPMLPEPDALHALVGGVVAVRPESPSGLHVRGAAADEIAYTLDDIPVLAPYHSAGVFGAWNPDAIARVALDAAAPSPALPDALGGVVAAATREPGARLETRGAVSTTQARLTIDGPLGAANAGLLVSARTGFVGRRLRRTEPSYLGGEAGDWLATLSADLLGGRLRLLGYGNDNELSAAATVDTAAAPAAPRNAFAWSARSLGASWTRRAGGATTRLVAWRAASDAGADWGAPGERVTTDGRRRDVGLLASVEARGRATTTLVGVRAERSATRYVARPDAAASGAEWTLAVRTPRLTAFAAHERELPHRLAGDVGASLALGGVARDGLAGRVRVAPSARLRWTPTGTLALSGSVARRWQFAQSLRDAESVVDNVFPAELFVGADARGVSVARADQAVLAADWRPAAGVRLGAQAYARRAHGVLLPSPRDGRPSAVGAAALTVGRGTARGVAIDAALAGPRVGAQGSYALERVRLNDGATSFTPEYGAAHVVDAGVVAFPTPTVSVRLGALGMFGRRATAVTGGGFEWEACNLLDGGCEFAGSPTRDGAAIGAARLPAYARVDLSVRKHWHVRAVHARGDPGTVALFGTVTNVLGRGNVLTYVDDPAGGAPTPVGMRPLAPLVVGLDWRW